MKMGAYSVKLTVGLDPRVGCQPTQQFQPRLRALRHADSDGMVDRDNRVVVETEEHAVQSDDLCPVGRFEAGCLVVHRGDRRLQLVGSRWSIRKCGRDDADALADRLAVPETPVLLRHDDERSIGSAPRSMASVREDHECEQPGHLTVSGKRSGKDPGKSNRFFGKIRPLQVDPSGARIAFVEDQIQHPQHRVETGRQLLRGRHGEADAAVLDRLLRAADSPGHALFGYQEGVGDLRIRQATDSTQGQRDLGRERQSGMATHEQQDEGVVTG